MSPHYFFMHTTISNIRLQLAYKRNTDAAMTNQFTGCGIVQTKKNMGKLLRPLTQAPSVLCESQLKLLPLIFNNQTNPVCFPKRFGEHQFLLLALSIQAPSHNSFNVPALQINNQRKHSPDYYLWTNN